MFCYIPSKVLMGSSIWMIKGIDYCTECNCIRSQKKNVNLKNVFSFFFFHDWILFYKHFVCDPMVEAKEKSENFFPPSLDSVAPER